MNYHVEPMHLEGDDFCWCVIERSTKQIVKSFSFEEDADEYCLFLNKGGAFDGNTPSFILRSVKLKQINSTFEEAFA